MISLPLLLLVQAPQQPPKAPRRQVPDSGIIATEQRVTPAGVQSVFDGRVTAVRFGTGPGEIWVAAPGGAYRLSWRDNRVVASSRFDGAPGVFGIAIDQAAGRQGVRVYYPRIEFCTDNAAMIAVAGLARLQAGQHDTLAIQARAQWPLQSLPSL